MSFKLTPDATFPEQVKFPKPGLQKEGREPLVIEFEFVWMAKSDWTAYCEAGVGKTDVEFLGGLIRNWDGEDPYSLEKLAELLAYYPGAERRIFIAYSNALNGAAEKN